MAWRYFRRRWDESRGDEYDDWGPAVYYFEVDEALQPLRQIEIYDGGPRLRYDAGHLSDDWGQLSDQPLDASDFGPFEVVASEFETAWAKGDWTNA